MSINVTIDSIRRAWDAHDPELVDLIVALAHLPEYELDKSEQEGAEKFRSFIREITSKDFHRKRRDEQQHFRTETLKALEAPDADPPLPERYRLHEIILALWNDPSPFARTSLVNVIREIPIVYGPWRALKRIFKEAEAKHDTEIYGALAARFDMAFSSGIGTVSKYTLGYLVRRAWRYLRRTAQTLPACYADIATDFLANYDDDVYLRDTWILNHVFYHGSGRYGAKGFHLGWGEMPNMMKNRAFPDLWQRSPRPLFSLIERAKADAVWEFATEALKSDFRATLREVEPSWVSRLVTVGSAIIDEFVVWILNNVPHFEQASFRELGLHDAVLKLFDSDCYDARDYAAQYVRTHARDVPVPFLIRLMTNDHDPVRKLAENLLKSLDPRTEVGLEAWGQLLETDEGNGLASSMLTKHFGPQELTPDWFKMRVLSQSEYGFVFAKENLTKLHPIDQLGSSFYCDVIDRLEDQYCGSHDVVDWAMDELQNFDANALDIEFLKRGLVFYSTKWSVNQWISSGRLSSDTFPIVFLKTIIDHRQWDTDPWIDEQKKSKRNQWDTVGYDETFTDFILEWLADSRQFAPQDLGLEWLMEMVSRGEARYQQFAANIMIQGLAPSVFAPPVAAAMSPEAEAIAGSERLWQLITDARKGDEPIARFAIKYIRRHHRPIYKDETGRDIDAETAVPDEFLSFDRVQPLCFDTRRPLRDFALELAKWNFARWSPSINELVDLCEAPDDRVREFVAAALLADDKPEHKHYRLDPDVLTADAVYSFCEAKDDGTRLLGMRLIEKYPRLCVPEELFRLTESPDRKVRAFVIRTIWSLYHDRGTTDDWKPNITPQTTVGAAAKRKAEEKEETRGAGAPPRPEEYPSTLENLSQFMRRILFEIPPAKLEKTRYTGEAIQMRLKPLPARKAKLALIEVMRDLAVEDNRFAAIALPLLEEFMASRGKSEQAACIVAVTRIRKSHPELSPVGV